jgi:enoyl-CoA hydratase
MGVDIEERADGIVIVWMNWPAKRNALGPTETRMVGEAIAQAGQLATCGVILTGRGAFCAGGDLEQFVDLSAKSSTQQVRTQIYENVHSVLRSIRDSSVPVAAAVDGPAIGLGLDYALACDMCFVGSRGWMQQGWALAGLIHGAGGSAFIQRAAGQMLWKLLIDQERLDPEKVEKLGLGEAVDGPALDTAVERLRGLSELPRDVLKAYTKLFRDERWPSDRFLNECANFQSEFIASEAFRYRAKAILEQRSSPASAVTVATRSRG